VLGTGCWVLGAGKMKSINRKGRKDHLR